MSYDAQSRDRHRLTVTVLTGAMTVGAIAATGWLAGQAARDFEQEQTEKQAPPETEPVKADTREQRRPLRERPTRTRVTTRYVSSDTPVAPVVDAPAADPAPEPAAPPPEPAPAPEPPPAPSSGS